MSRQKIILPEYVAVLCEELRRSGAHLVFTNGVFDLLHPGHVHYLTKARRLGTHLIVAANDDESAQRMKGWKRPLNDLTSRMEILAALEPVDFVTWFQQDTPAEIIRLVHPDILVKGSDWSTEKIIGKEFVESYGGKVLTVPLLKGYSTTALIEKVLHTI
jgi:rfaE bifunctional protein nucleotidyltransferase chain/domain